MRVLFVTPARQELVRASEFYDGEAPALGTDFILDVEETTELIREFPRLGAPSAGGTRRVNLRQFPYFVVYRIESDDLIRVFALQHHRSQPDQWQDRL